VIRRRWVEGGLLFVGASALGFWGIVSAFSTSLESAANRELAGSSGRFARPQAEGDLVGRLEIPRLQISSVVLEGVSDATLRVASGHIPGTPLPGEGGNAGIAAHRDGAFRELSSIEAGDRVVMTTPRGSRTYRVAFTSIVEPDDTRLLAPAGVEALTLVTCYPFQYAGSAPQRFIVRALRSAMPN
jgi:sortase A